MGNMARITLPRQTTLAEYHASLKEALQATFGDALSMDPEVPTLPEESGIVIQAGEQCLCQWFYESPTEWSVDHRFSDLGYWVSDRMFLAMAAKLGGTVQEDCMEDPMDLDRPLPDKFLPYALHGREPTEIRLANITEMYGDEFKGALAPFWK